MSQLPSVFQTTSHRFQDSCERQQWKLPSFLANQVAMFTCTCFRGTCKRGCLWATVSWQRPFRPYYNHIWHVPRTRSSAYKWTRYCPTKVSCVVHWSNCMQQIFRVPKRTFHSSGGSTPPYLSSTVVSHSVTCWRICFWHKVLFSPILPFKQTNNKQQQLLAKIKSVWHGRIQTCNVFVLNLDISLHLEAHALFVKWSQKQTLFSCLFSFSVFVIFRGDAHFKAVQNGLFR